MPFVLTVLVLSVSLSYARGGRLHRIPEAALRGSWLLFVGVGLQVLVDVLAARGVFGDASTLGWSLLLASQVIVVVWLIANWHLPGILLVALGLLANAVVIAANGAMPVSPDAMRALGIGETPLTGGKHTLLTDDSRLVFLADVFPLPPLRSIISIGDIVLAAGLVPLTHALMTRRAVHERRGGARVADPV